MVNPQAHAGGGASSPGTGQSGADHLKDDASSLVDDAKTEAKDKVDDLRGTAADKVDTLAEGIQAAASKFEGNDIGHMSDYVTELADSLGRLSSSMRDKSGDELLKEVTRLARENPALFVTGSIAVGFGLSRFAKASASHGDSRNPGSTRTSNAPGARAPESDRGNAASGSAYAGADTGAPSPAGATSPAGPGPSVVGGNQSPTQSGTSTAGQATSQSPGVRP